MKRREFIGLLGGSAVALPIAARAQLKIPVIAWLNARPEWTDVLTEARRGLAENGYIEGRDFAFEYRFAPNYQPGPLAANAIELVQRGVAVIFAITMPEALAAKEATKSIPIIFQVGLDPVATGLVTSLSRPGGNLTGASILNSDLVGKRLEILHKLVPSATSIAYLVNPHNQAISDTETEALLRAARALGIKILVLNVTETSELDAAFTTLTGERVGAVFVGADAIFLRSRNQLAALTARYAMPTIYANRNYMLSGGVSTGCLVSFGTYYGPGYRIMGTYAARILKGEKPSDLPVQQITKTDFVINLKTAKELGLTIPATLLVTADEVIE